MIPALAAAVATGYQAYAASKTQPNPFAGGPVDMSQRIDARVSFGPADPGFWSQSVTAQLPSFYGAQGGGGGPLSPLPGGDSSLPLLLLAGVAVFMLTRG